MERSARSEGGNWRLELVVEPVEVPTDHAVQLGLLANELVMNAIKHAYRPLAATMAGAGAGSQSGAPDRARGDTNIIVVGLRRDGETLEMIVGDRGVGLPPDFDWRRSRSLGMRLIHTLSKQLDATLSIESTDPGVRFTIRLPHRVSGGGNPE